jgi:transcriptional regulator with XRE-family HTH domain
MYREARKVAGLTLEEAAWRLAVAPRTLGKYESGELAVPPETVIRMGETYDEPELLPWHCSAKCPIGRVLRPVFQSGDLAIDTLALLKELRDVNDCVSALVEIAADGQVEPSEAPEFQAILKELGELKAAIDKISLLGAKIAARGAGKEAKAA